MKKQSSISLSSDALLLADAMKKKLGVSRNAVTELSIREKAEREGISIQDAKKMLQDDEK
ncbi:MAG TPA: hypothetical protein VF681_03675 [Abditibacteriaceae bacterium]|jgi:hypothetical protein